MLLVLDSDPGFTAAVGAALRRSDLQPAETADDVERALRTGTITGVIVGPNGGADAAFGIAARLHETAPGVGVVMVERKVTATILQAALRAGVRDVLPADFKAAALVDAVQRSESAVRGHEPDSAHDDAPEPGRIITVFSPKGGVGKSCVATNLAVLLAANGKQVAAVDLDLQFGDLAIMLQLFPSRTIYDAATAAGEMDPQTLVQYLTPHRSGVGLLPAPLEPGLAENVTADAAQKVLMGLRTAGRTVVVDTPPWFNDHVLQALDVSDEMVLVATMDVPSIKNLKVALQTLAMLGYPRERLRLVLNRADSKVGLSIADVERALGTSVDVAVPSSREVPLSVNRGTPLALADPASPVPVALAKLAALVSIEAGPVAAAPPAAKKSRFGRRGR
ncbi:MAG TPA: P-loop NTPase [Actinomycetota bacterium]